MPDPETSPVPATNDGASNTAIGSSDPSISINQPSRVVAQISGVSPTDAVRALRLGWMVAEVRGRLRPDAPTVGSKAPEQAGSSLLLAAADERTPAERQIEAAKILAAMAHDIHVDLPIKRLTNQSAEFPGEIQGASDALKYLVCGLITARNPRFKISETLQVPLPVQDDSTAQDWWDRFATFIWAWDQVIQDELAAGEFGTASAYQLGRGLAETYWALDPGRIPPAADPDSWGFLLGENRVHAYALLLQRLRPVIGTLTAVGIAASVTAWGKVALNPHGYKDPEIALSEQTLVWRDLLLTGRDPTTLVDSQVLAKAARRIRPLLKAFSWELALGVIAAVVLGLSAFHHSQLTGTVGAVLGVFGLTTSALAARTKAMLQTVGTRVREEIYEDVVVVAIQNLPKPLDGSGVNIKVLLNTASHPLGQRRRS